MHTDKNPVHIKQTIVCLDSDTKASSKMQVQHAFTVICSHTHTHTHVHTHTHTHARTHARTHTHTYKRARTYIHTYIQSYIRAMGLKKILLKRERSFKKDLIEVTEV